MAKLVLNIMRQMDAGKTVEEISKKNRVDIRIVNHILQIYTTHPGIDVQGYSCGKNKKYSDDGRW